MVWDDALRLLAALVAGALIGIERELHGKPAGFRTNTLICVGSALFTILSIRVAQSVGGDETRIAAQIVTGIGFLGAGAIIHGKNHVIGLTTAATVWAVAGVGMALGAGLYVLGAVATLLIHGVLLLFLQFEPMIEQFRRAAAIEIRVERAADSSETVRRRIEAIGLRCEQWSVKKDEEELVITATLTGRRQNILRLQAELLAEPRIRAFSWL